MENKITITLTNLLCDWYKNYPDNKLANLIIDLLIYRLSYRWLINSKNSKEAMSHLLPNEKEEFYKTLILTTHFWENKENFEASKFKSNDKKDRYITITLPSKLLKFDIYENKSIDSLIELIKELLINHFVYTALSNPYNFYYLNPPPAIQYLTAKEHKELCEVLKQERAAKNEC